VDSENQDNVYQKGNDKSSLNFITLIFSTGLLLLLTCFLFDIICISIKFFVTEFLKITRFSI